MNPSGGITTDILLVLDSLTLNTLICPVTVFSRVSLSCWKQNNKPTLPAQSQIRIFTECITLLFPLIRLTFLIYIAQMNMERSCLVFNLLAFLQNCRDVLKNNTIRSPFPAKVLWTLTALLQTERGCGIPFLGFTQFWATSPNFEAMCLARGWMRWPLDVPFLSEILLEFYFSIYSVFILLI